MNKKQELIDIFLDLGKALDTSSVPSLLPKWTDLVQEMLN